MIGKTIWKYRIVEFLGSGGSARVYRATDTRTDRSVAIKILPEGYRQEDLTRFKNETRAIQKFEHPNVIKIHDIGVDGQTNYYVMEYVDEARTLKERLHEAYEVDNEPLAFKEVLHLSIGLARALEYIHGHSIYHRDIKPGNIMIRPTGEVILMDFGLAKAVEEEGSVTQVGALVGTPLYMAPEQLQGQPVDQRTDLYQLGIVMYKMACGKVPFEGDKAYAVAARRLTDKIPPPSRYNPRVNPGLEKIILRVTLKDMDRRYQNATDMLRDLESLREGGHIRAEEDTAQLSDSDMTPIPVEPPRGTMPLPKAVPAAASGAPEAAAAPAERNTKKEKRQTSVTSLSAVTPPPAWPYREWVIRGTAFLLGLGFASLGAWISAPGPIRLKVSTPKVEVHPTSVTLTFSTSLPVVAELRYHDAESTDEKLAFISEHPSREHQVTLESLAPGRSYKSGLRLVLEGDRLVSHPGPDFATQSRSELERLVKTEPGQRTPEETKQLVQALTSSDFQVRLRALEALESDPPKDAVEPLKQALFDENPSVRMAAHRALGKLLLETR